MWFDRTEQTGVRQTSKTKSFPAPTRGWIRNDAIAQPKPGGAEVLDNWVPTSEGARMRKGCIKRAQITGAVTHFAIYDAGTSSKFFATSASAIYDVTSPADPDVSPAASVSGLTSGLWSSVQFATSGGARLVMVNGFDSMRQYTGSVWVTITDVSTPIAITGIATTQLEAVWKFKSRLFFTQKGSMSAWYLPVLSFGGTASEFPLGGIFTSGGSLLFGATYSMDAGDGLDDYCLFVTDKGEVAVYQGTDPSSATDFQLVGVYKIGRPLGKNAWFKGGGDVAVVTDDAIIPLSQAIKSDRAALSGIAITYPIETAWRALVSSRDAGTFPFTVALWQAQALLVVGVPTYGNFDPVCLVFNTRTGAAARFVGWDTRDVVVFEDKLYFGTGDGEVMQGDVGGSDDGMPYSAIVIPRFDGLGTPDEKSAIHARIVARGNIAFTPQLFANADFEVSIPTPLNADPDTDPNLWDTGIWNLSTWGVSTELKARISEWQSVAANGQALTVGLQITSGRVTAPDVELIRLDLQYEEGEVMA